MSAQKHRRALLAVLAAPALPGWAAGMARATSGAMAATGAAAGSSTATPTPAAAAATAAGTTTATGVADGHGALAAAWDTAVAHRIGLLVRAGAALQVAASLEVPTRAHGLLWERGGSLLAVARRPGDWLLRWHPHGAAEQRVWNRPDRSFNGHVLAHPDGRRLYTTETDLETGAGLVVVRDAASLEPLAAWPSHGLDPHELTWDAEGRLVVANGGIPSLPETGRAKRGLERMDSSLVRLDATSGRLLGQWRLADARLSLRHLARQGPHIGIALQAEHDAAEARLQAPVLALFDGHSLRAIDAPQALAGYGGDIAAHAGGFAVACPRAGGVARWNGGGRWAGFTPLAEGCALAAAPSDLWVGGVQAALRQAAPCTERLALPELRLDNHWVLTA